MPFAESPPPTPSLSPSKAAQAMATAQKNKADTPPVGKGGNRKPGGRPAARGRRVGRNQYTRDLPNGEGSDTPHRDTSHDRNGNGSPNGGTNGVNGESGRSSKARTHPARTSLNEMKKRVAGILEFVGQMQTQQVAKVSGSRASGSNSSTSLKGNSTPAATTTGGPVLPTSNLVQAVTAGLKEMDKQKEKDVENGENSTLNGKVKIVDDADFARMGSQEMMETLTKELVQWQAAFGVYTR